MLLKCCVCLFIILYQQKKVYGQVTVSVSGSLNEGSSVVISCIITNFGSSGASWSNDGTNILTQCFASGHCTNSGNSKYNYTSESSGIYVTIDPLDKSDDGKNWICSHGTGSDNKTVTLESDGFPTTETSTTRILTSTTNHSKDSSKCSLFCIISIVAAIILIIALFVCCVKLKSKRSHGKDSPSAISMAGENRTSSGVPFTDANTPQSATSFPGENSVLKTSPPGTSNTDLQDPNTGIKEPQTGTRNIDQIVLNS